MALAAAASPATIPNSNDDGAQGRCDDRYGGRARARAADR
jgi:hypothetical protein